MFLVWTIILIYHVYQFTDPGLLEKAPAGKLGAAFLLTASITLLCQNMIETAVKRLFSQHKVPPAESICPSVRADQAYSLLFDMNIQVIHIKTTNYKYKKTGYYKRGKYSWILIESEK